MVVLWYCGPYLVKTGSCGQYHPLIVVLMLFSLLLDFCGSDEVFIMETKRVTTAPTT